MAVVKINLVPDLVLNRRRDAQVRRIALASLVGWCALVVVVTLIAVGLHAYASSRLSHANSTYANLNAQVNSPANVAFRTEALDVQTSLAALDQLFNHQEKMSVITAAVAAVMPKETVLGELQITTGQMINLTAQAPSYASAGSLVAALKDTSSNTSQVWFDQVSLGTATLSSGSVGFSVTAHYNLPTSSSTSGANQ